MSGFHFCNKFDVMCDNLCMQKSSSFFDLLLVMVICYCIVKRLILGEFYQ